MKVVNGRDQPGAKDHLVVAPPLKLRVERCENARHVNQEKEKRK